MIFTIIVAKLYPYPAPLSFGEGLGERTFTYQDEAKKSPQ